MKEMIETERLLVYFKETKPSDLKAGLAFIYQ
jgi:hypothetical protein